MNNAPVQDQPAGETKAEKSVCSPQAKDKYEDA